MDDLHLKLEAALKKRNALATEISKLQGQLESAKKAKATVEDECRKKGIEPEKIDAAIETLTTRIATAVTELEAGIQATNKALEPFRTGDIL